MKITGPHRSDNNTSVSDGEEANAKEAIATWSLEGMSAKMMFYDLLDQQEIVKRIMNDKKISFNGARIKVQEKLEDMENTATALWHRYKVARAEFKEVRAAAREFAKMCRELEERQKMPPPPPLPPEVKSQETMTDPVERSPERDAVTTTMSPPSIPPPR